ncbi:MAG: hemin receptor [Piscinibacter sp.]|nr:hemin receptor [Piscinibacter sp.]
MTPQQIELIRRSHALIAPQAERAGTLFYHHLFTLAPALQPLFIGDIRQQSARLMQMIGAAVGLLDRPQELLPVLAHLGARHAGYGVQARDYQVVGVALLETLQEALDAAFDSETRAAWTAMYALVSTTMIAAAHAESAPQTA